MQHVAASAPPASEKEASVIHAIRSWFNRPTQIGWALAATLVVAGFTGWQVSEWRAESACDAFHRQYDRLVNREVQYGLPAALEEDEYRLNVDEYGKAAADRMREMSYSMTRDFPSIVLLDAGIAEGC